MKITPFFLLPLSLPLTLAACALAAPAPTPTPTLAPSPTPEWERPGWTLVWQDEFEGDTLNLDNWTFDIGGNGWGNQEAEAYTNRPENVRVEDGMLVIEAREEPDMIAGKDYSSARLKTQGLQEFQYGRIEARLKLPYGQGLWPAFWMLGNDIYKKAWPVSGEIDILEFVGKEPGTVYATVHGPGYSGGDGVGSWLEVGEDTLRDDFHVYAIEWEADEIRCYFDDRQYFQLTPDQVPGEWVFDHPFFLILNLAVGGRWPGYPDDTTVFPQFLQVDYVRVYQDATTGADYPVQGTVLLEDGACCVGGPVDQPIPITAAFEAKSPSGEIVQMRVAEQCLSPAEMEAQPWQPLAETQDFTFTPTVANWFGFTVGVQYRDEQGNLSDVVCDDISVEGQPPPP
jgi:beta-glucanase (GH16 family)